MTSVPVPIETEKGAELARQLSDIGREFYQRGWVMGTSGNFSAVISHDPLRLAITASGLDKGALTPGGIIRMDQDGNALGTAARPSAEAALHLAILRSRPAGAILHTHSVWGTLLSDACLPDGGVAFEGYEMLKGLAGVRTHEHREWLPIVPNSQEYTSFAQSVEDLLSREPAAHGFFIHRHGLYTWGADLAEARRHVEILEFLMEIVARLKYAGGSPR